MTKSTIVSRKLATFALMRVSMTFLSTNSLRMSLPFVIPTMVIPFQLILLSTIPVKILNFLIRLLPRLPPTTLILPVMTQLLAYLLQLMKLVTVLLLKRFQPNGVSVLSIILGHTRLLARNLRDTTLLL